MISVSYSGWLVISLIVQIAGFALVLRAVKNTKDQSMIDMRAIAAMLQKDK